MLSIYCTFEQYGWECAVKLKQCWIVDALVLSSSTVDSPAPLTPLVVYPERIVPIFTQELKTWISSHQLAMVRACLIRLVPSGTSYPGCLGLRVAMCPLIVIHPCLLEFTVVSPMSSVMAVWSLVHGQSWWGYGDTMCSYQLILSTFMLDHGQASTLLYWRHGNILMWCDDGCTLSGPVGERASLMDNGGECTNMWKWVYKCSGTR